MSASAPTDLGDERANPPGETWFLLQTGAGESAFNMALDEALLGAAPRLAHPVLRFYAWTEPAATFGYFQRHADVAALTPLRPLLRRPTGGGIVPHDRDWTYTLVFPPGHRWYGLRARESYERVHAWLQRAFLRLNLAAELAGKEQPGAGRCFAGAELNDLLWRGVKIAGAAQRRAKTGLLIQGSVQPPANPPDRSDWESAVCTVAANDWGIRWKPLQIPSEVSAEAERLYRDKYETAAYNRGR